MRRKLASMTIFTISVDGRDATFHVSAGSEGREFLTALLTLAKAAERTIGKPAEEILEFVKGGLDRCDVGKPS